MNTIVSTNFQLPTAVISNGALTGIKWSNPNFLLLTDSQNAESSPSQGQASDVIVGNFNLANVPQNAVITGIEVELIGAYAATSTNPATTLTPYFVDDTGGSNVYYPYVTPQILTITPTDYVLGSSTYLFATSFTPNQINNAKIALVANGDVFVDAVKINIFYYIPSTPSPVPPSGSSCDDCNSPIQAQPFYLALPFKAGDRYAYLQSFNYPDGTPIQYADLGSCGGFIKLVFDPAVPKIGNSNFEENAVTAVWTTLPSGQVKLDFGDISVNRGLMFHTPYTADPLLRSNHDANSKVIISDSAPFLGQYLQKCQIDALISAPIIVENQDVPLPSPAHDIDFRGPGVSTANDGFDPHRKIVTIPGAGGTIPPQITATTSATTGSTPQLTLSADLVITGLNRGTPIQILGEESKTIISVTVGGVSATQKVVITDVPNNLRDEQWFCANPPLGTQPVVVTWSTPTLFSFGAECVNGLDPVTPVGAVQSASGTSLNPTLTIVTTVNYSIVIDGLGTAQTPILYTPGVGQGANWHETANADTRQGGSSVQAAGLQPDTIIMNYSITQNTPWVYTAMELVGITQGSTDEKVKVSTTDTTPGFLDPKLNLHSSDASVLITKAALVPGNQVLDYDFKVVGGGSGGGNLIKEDSPHPAGSTYGTVTPNPNGIVTVFTVGSAKYVSGKLTVWKNGQELNLGTGKDWVETNPAAGTFTFTIAPLTTDNIYVEYYSPTTISQTGIQFDLNGAIIPGAISGATKEFDIQMPGATANFSGGKVTYTLPIGGGGGVVQPGVTYDFMFSQSNVSFKPWEIFMANQIIKFGTRLIVGYNGGATDAAGSPNISQFVADVLTGAPKSENSTLDFSVSGGTRLGGVSVAEDGLSMYTCAVSNSAPFNIILRQYDVNMNLIATSTGNFGGTSFQWASSALLTFFVANGHLVVQAASYTGSHPDLFWTDFTISGASLTTPSATNLRFVTAGGTITGSSYAVYKFGNAYWQDAKQNSGSSQPSEPSGNVNQASYSTLVFGSSTVSTQPIDDFVRLNNFGQTNPHGGFEVPVNGQIGRWRNTTIIDVDGAGSPNYRSWSSGIYNEYTF